jgi:hypothetical protein
MILVEHEMLALPENLSLSPVFRRVEMILTYLVENMFICHQYKKVKKGLKIYEYLLYG